MKNKKRTSAITLTLLALGTLIFIHLHLKPADELAKWTLTTIMGLGSLMGITGLTSKS